LQQQITATISRIAITPAETETTTTACSLDRNGVESEFGSRRVKDSKRSTSTVFLSDIYFYMFLLWSSVV